MIGVTLLHADATTLGRVMEADGQSPWDSGHSVRDNVCCSGPART